MFLHNRSQIRSFWTLSTPLIQIATAGHCIRILDDYPPYDREGGDISSDDGYEYLETRRQPASTNSTFKSGVLDPEIHKTRPPIYDAMFTHEKFIDEEDDVRQAMYGLTYVVSLLTTVL